MFNFRTLDQLNQLIRRNLSRLPWQPQVLAGVHKSGLLAATLFSAHLNVPAIPLRQLWEADWIYSGVRGLVGTAEQEAYLAEPRRVLVVEDAALSGGTFRRELEQALEYSRASHDFFTLVCYGGSAQLAGANLVLEVCPPPRLFEWNWRDHQLLTRSLLDLDGVFCPDPPMPEEETEAYLNFLRTAPLLYVPKRAVLGIVTARLEKYREETLTWLKEHGIAVHDLYMANFQTPQERRKHGHAKIKAAVYRQREDAELFVESSDRQAQQIFELTGRPVLSLESLKLRQHLELVEPESKT